MSLPNTVGLVHTRERETLTDVLQGRLMKPFTANY